MALMDAMPAGTKFPTSAPSTTPAMEPQWTLCFGSSPGEKVMEYPVPDADSPGFWRYPLALEHPLASVQVDVGLDKGGQDQLSGAVEDLLPCPGGEVGVSRPGCG